MNARELLLLRAEDVRAALEGREDDIVAAVRGAYEAHRKDQTSLPHSVFLHPPHGQDRRIIGLPAWIDSGGPDAVAGIKWIASFPSNHERGLQRASAVMILNSPETGFPVAVLEGSIISANRTAASAALAARWLAPANGSGTVGVVGCGPINLGILRYLAAIRNDLGEAVVYDLERNRSERFARKAAMVAPGLKIRPVDSLKAAIAPSSLVSFATTSAEPYVPADAGFAPGATVLHISLRDLRPETILGVDNVVDDVDHVCRAGTSLHLTEEQVGHRDFIRSTLADVTLGHVPARPPDPSKVTVFSPFGLGVLDLALARLVVDNARAASIGQVIPSFLPEPGL